MTAAGYIIAGVTALFFLAFLWARIGGDIDFADDSTGRENVE